MNKKNQKMNNDVLLKKIKPHRKLEKKYVRWGVLYVVIKEDFLEEMTLKQKSE